MSRMKHRVWSDREERNLTKLLSVSQAQNMMSRHHITRSRLLYRHRCSFVMFRVLLSCCRILWRGFIHLQARYGRKSYFAFWVCSHWRTYWRVYGPALVQRRVILGFNREGEWFFASLRGVLYFRTSEFLIGSANKYLLMSVGEHIPFDGVLLLLYIDWWKGDSWSIAFMSEFCFTALWSASRKSLGTKDLTQWFWDNGLRNDFSTLMSMYLMIYNSISRSRDIRATPGPSVASFCIFTLPSIL